ncbi:hypothetical protein NQ315_000237 [Exocentrus adspersus]|uniref:Peptidase S1 domain-containing protein n=1 Tax=Exocentrus adspersus TaxID=1586481 RepID=A0AAV8VQD9_9CUCU|nr:hypothetical protein NQ315_000237 [Exocentrus adspersus]
MSLCHLLLVFFLIEINRAYPTVGNVTSGCFVHPTLAKSNDDLINGRIIGGKEAEPHAYPYQVGLYCHGATDTHFCGGSFVSPNYVLTAAHCVEGKLSVDLIFGAHAIEESENSQIKQTSTEFIIHSGWDEGDLINDIALVKLRAPVPETNYIKMIKITADGGNTFAGDHGTMTGWGLRTMSQHGLTSTLLYAVNDILSNEQCKSVNANYDRVVQSTHLCLSGVTSGNVNVGTCNGDSGGPLTVNGVQVGLVSFGNTDCEAGKPSVFTRLTEYKDWIRENSDVVI